MGNRPRIAILGGGMAALAAAWELSRGDWRERYGSITVYQRGWRLGGKGASSRGANGRIEEHGLHILLGYYYETFRLMRSCYEELDRWRRRPAAPIKSWDEAVMPSGRIGLVDGSASGWMPWVTDFLVPAGAADEGAIDRGPLRLVDVVRRSLRLLLDFHRSSTQRLVLSTSPHPPPGRIGEETSALLRAAGITALAGTLELVDQAADAASALATRMRLSATLGRALRELGDAIEQAPTGGTGVDRTRRLIDLVLTNLRGIVADGLLTRPEGLRLIDGIDYREWLRGHGASPATVDQAIVRGMYDLTFAYEDGDPARPRFAAGLGLELATRMLLGHDGPMFWRMRAGMGEVIFAPIYEVLTQRGVDFRFFHRVDRLQVGTDRTSIERIHIGRQVDVRGGAGGYQPLIEVAGLPCWPDRPAAGQLVDGERIGDANLESLWSEWDDTETIELMAGRDFDQVVFAISLGMVPHVAAELISASVRWREMVANVATVGTQSLQLWLTSREEEMGWRGGPGVTLSGFAHPFGTWASMNHLLSIEGWPTDDRPATLAYFCDTLATTVDSAAAEAAARREVRSNALRFLSGDIRGIWPDAVGEDGDFKWAALAGAGGLAGPERIDSQYFRASVDPSDRYVQSLPGTDRYRLRPDDTGFRNLVVAGDWTDCGLNAGCIEAATRSGILAARAVADRTEDMVDPKEKWQ
jgi:uncharacterized protein with NAD-binding domain and iron-sulfur cluster